MSSGQVAPQQPPPALATPDELSGPPFRFAPPNSPYDHRDPTGSRFGWNAIPPQRRSMPANFWGTPTAQMYLKLMDQEMDQLRRSTHQGWTTRLAFKEAFYRAERHFRDWLLEQPDAVFWGFVRDFNVYDQRVALMTMRYENRKSGQVALRAQLQEHRQKFAA